jgi:hypothetical protein
MAILRLDFFSGYLSQTVDPSDNVLQSNDFQALPAVGGGDVLKLVLDPFRQRGPRPEVVYVTGHVAGQSQVTVLRGQDGTVARTYGDVGTMWLHGPLTSDWTALSSALSAIQATPGTVLPVGGPTYSSPGDVSAQGTSSALARADHRHGREQPEAGIGYATKSQGEGTNSSSTSYQSNAGLIGIDFVKHSPDTALLISGKAKWRNTLGGTNYLGITVEDWGSGAGPVLSAGPFELTRATPGTGQLLYTGSRLLIPSQGPNGLLRGNPVKLRISLVWRSTEGQRQLDADTFSEITVVEARRLGTW